MGTDSECLVYLTGINRHGIEENDLIRKMGGMPVTAESRDEAYREYALSGTMWKVLLKMGLPLAFYESLNCLYKILDSLMASHINAEAVSTVAYLAQISMVISSVGQGLAIGGSLKVSEAYGAGDYELVKKRVSSLFALGVILDAFVLLLIPLTPEILRLAGTPDELAAGGIIYFQIELFGLAITFLNNTYIAIERARGNTKRIFGLNTIVIILKLVLTALFVYGLNCGISMISAASILSQLVLLGFGSYHMTRGDTAFAFSLKSISWKKETLFPLLQISLPSIIERAAFSGGKVIMNAMCARYGSLTVGALGICNNVSGIFSNAESGIQAGASAVMSQNLGGRKPERVLKAVKEVFLINLVIGGIGTVISLAGMDAMSYIYAMSSEGLNIKFQKLIQEIFFYDALGTIVPWGIAASVEAFLYALGKTKIILFLNVCRLFAFRIFPLWMIQTFTNAGSECLGIVMMMSNTFTAVLACILVYFELKKFRRKWKL